MLLKWLNDPRGPFQLGLQALMSLGRTSWALICGAVLAVILSLGLWPFHVPGNDVMWLKDRPGIAFGRFSAAIGTDAVKAVDSADLGGTLEIWLRPAYMWDDSTVLGFSSPGNPNRLLVRQSLTDLKLQTEAMLKVKEVFRKKRPFFLTITSGAGGTSVYIDGVLVKIAPQVRLSTSHFSGRLVVGDAPRQSDSWRGQIYGLALYHRRLEPAEVLRHYSTWTREGRPRTTEAERNVALYLFQERAGKVVHNSVGPGSDLQIPEKYLVVDKICLDPFWREFNLSQSYLSSAVKNIVGFVPLGFCFYGYLVALRVRRAALATVILGAAVSVTIEVLQGYLPTRDSGTTDIITNTLGTWTGVVSFKFAGRWYTQRARAASAIRV